MVLVIYRSDSPPPESLRCDIESAVDAVAGGSRVSFLGVGEAFSDLPATRDGVERARWRALQHRLSLLLPSSSGAGEKQAGATGAAIANQP